MDEDSTHRSLGLTWLRFFGSVFGFRVFDDFLEIYFFFTKNNIGLQTSIVQCEQQRCEKKQTTRFTDVHCHSGDLKLNTKTCQAALVQVVILPREISYPKKSLFAHSLLHIGFVPCFDFHLLARSNFLWDDIFVLEVLFLQGFLPLLLLFLTVQQKQQKKNMASSGL